MRTPPNHPLLEYPASNRPRQSLTGRFVTGPANESYLLNQYGIPTYTFGPVGAGAHSVGEYVEVESIFQVAQVYAATALKMAHQD
ncbi:MAG: hypothetical protein MUO62_02780 [Anaerolineales bacterium]|nr:hypothetical protein [Anaerolineales bacterium]